MKTVFMKTFLPEILNGFTLDRSSIFSRGSGAKQAGANQGPLELVSLMLTASDT